MIDVKKSFIAYLQAEKNYSTLTVSAYLKDITSFERFVLLNYENENDLVAVNYGQIRNWIVSLIDKGLSNISVNRKIASLKAFYKFLIKVKHIEMNPLLRHKSLKVPKKVQIPFSEKELVDVLAPVNFPNTFEGIRDKLIIDLLYTTGIRRAELINLKMYNVSLVTNTVKVLGKRNKERILPVLPVVLEQFQLYLLERTRLNNVVDKDYFFLTLKGNKLYDSFVYRLINDYFSKVSEKVKKSPHILRHTFATHMLNNGADLNSVKELLGHSSLASTQVYTHNSLAELKKVYGEAHPRNPH